MAGKRGFDIAFVGLKPGVHEFAYEIKDEFFKDYDQQDFTNCNALVKLSLDKNNGFMMLKFEVGGSLEVTCDRCGNGLPMQLWDEFKMVVKLVDDPEVMNDQEEDADVHYISRSESHLHVADWIYEFINLSIPMQRMCNEDEIGGPHCNKEVLARLNQMQPGENKEPANNIWKGLDKIKGLEE